MIKNIPNTPGIYLFYNNKKELVYVGKATSLKSRVSSYFSGSNNDNRPIKFLINEVKDVKYKETGSAIEAAILEANYIKKYKPKYNIKGKDNKTFNYLYLTKEDFPKLKTIRGHQLKEIEKYKYLFGPYPNIKTSEMLKILHNLFFISRCNPNAKKPCFDYQIKQCLGVCINEIDKKTYNQRVIRPLVEFLRGNKKKVIKDLEKQMKTYSSNSKFEEAQKIKIQINKLKKIQDISFINKSFVGENIEDEKIKRIEGYDISNLGENNKVGSMVVFNESGPIKKAYRKFKIKSIEGQSDVDCLKEVLERRMKHIEWEMPEMILVDGGKPQVNVFRKILKNEIFVFGIAKGINRDKDEFVFLDHNKKYIDYILNNKNLFLQVRDEAHRFAINYQRKLGKII